jgi:hypothetical protein
MNKGLPITKVPLDANVIRIPVEAMTRLEVEEGIKDKLTELENMKPRKRKIRNV